MTRPDNSLVSSDNARELVITKLTRIHGVARKTALAMYEIGIHSYSDLIDYLNRHTSEEFSTALSERGVNRRPGLIDKKSWIEQAEMLHRIEKAPDTLSPPPGEGESQRKSEEAGRKSGHHDAVFTVSFDIAKDSADQLTALVTVYNESNGGEESAFQSTDPAIWVNWMLERVKLPPFTMSITPQVEVPEKALPLESESRHPPISQEEYDVRLEISDIQLSMNRAASKVPEKGLEAQIDVRLSGTDAERLTLLNIPFRIDVYTIALDNGFPRCLLSREERFKPRVFEYSYKLGFAVPEVGQYEFHSLIRLLPSGKLKAYRQGPTLRVIP